MAWEWEQVAGNSPDAGAVVRGISLAFPEMEVGGYAVISVVSDLSGHLFGRFVPARHVVDQNHAAPWASSQRSRQVGVNLITIVSVDQNRLRYHTLVVCHQSLLICVRVAFLLHPQPSNGSDWPDWNEGYYGQTGVSIDKNRR